MRFLNSLANSIKPYHSAQATRGLMRRRWKLVFRSRHVTRSPVSTSCLLLVLNSYTKHATCLHSHFFLSDDFFLLFCPALTMLTNHKHALVACFDTRFRNFFSQNLALGQRAHTMVARYVRALCFAQARRASMDGSRRTRARWNALAWRETSCMSRFRTPRQGTWSLAEGRRGVCDMVSDYSGHDKNENFRSFKYNSISTNTSDCCISNHEQ